MNLIEILSSGFDDLSTESGGEELKTYFCSVPFDLTDDEIKKAVAAKWPATHCTHEHDCCGRYYNRPAFWTRGEYRGRITVTQRSVQNV